FHAAPDVSLDDDLVRRDLTINAMAQEEGGQVFDPFNGRMDLKARLLRHVSPSFAEDPLRVLRVARFAARYHWLGFRVADDTLVLMRQLADSGELDYLVPERVWKETSRALMERDPQVFFQVLHACGALKVLLPELASLDGVPQPEQHHPEVDTLVHQWLSLEQASRLNLPLTARYAVLCHDLGKGKTPEEEWPRHIAHEIRSARLAKTVSKRWRVPKDAATLAALVAEYHTHCHRALELKPATVWKLLKTLDVIRRPERLEDFLLSCEADARGRTGLEDRPYPQVDYLRGAAQAASNIDVAALRQSGIEGPALGEAIENARIHAISEFKKTWQTPSP
ncbi:MAG: multifunctional CCA addition/repair protein, partial [Alcanivorax sp.]